jgi:VanZ family protein
VKPPKKLSILLWCLVVFWMGFIFYQSSKSANISLSRSGQLISWVAETIYHPYNQMDEPEKQEFVEKWQIPIRKLAHFIEYLIFGFLVSLAVGLLPGKPKVMFVLVFIFWVLYAATDEVHQAYVPGRNPSIVDVFIDSAGALAGILVANKIFLPIKNRRARQAEIDRYNRFRKNRKNAAVNPANQDHKSEYPPGESSGRGKNIQE